MVIYFLEICYKIFYFLAKLNLSKLSIAFIYFIIMTGIFVSFHFYTVLAKLLQVCLYLKGGLR